MTKTNIQEKAGSEKQCIAVKPQAKHRIPAAPVQNPIDIQTETKSMSAAVSPPPTGEEDELEAMRLRLIAEAQTYGKLKKASGAASASQPKR